MAELAVSIGEKHGNGLIFLTFLKNTNRGERLTFLGRLVCERSLHGGLRHHCRCGHQQHCYQKKLNLFHTLWILFIDF